MTSHAVVAVVAVVASLLAGAAPGQGWPQFRGPGGLAVAPAGCTVPIPFTLEAHRQWRVEVAPGHSSPAVWGDSVFLTGYRGDRLLMSCHARRTGELLWQESVKAQGKESRLDDNGCPAMASPCTDGERVFFYFGAYGLQARSFDGALLWEKTLPVPRSEFGTGSSPILAGAAVVVVRDGAPDSAVLAFARTDGAELWRVPRPLHAVTYATPFLWRNRRRSELVIAGSGRLVALEPDTGRRLWSVEDGPVLACPTPTGDLDRVYFGGWNPPASSGAPLLESLFGIGKVTRAEAAEPEALFRKLDADRDGRIAPAEVPDSRARDWFDPIDTDGDGRWKLDELRAVLAATKVVGRNALLAVAPGGDGTRSGADLSWTLERGLPYVPSPLLYQGRLYVLKSGGLVTCCDPATGKPRFERRRLPHTDDCFASPIGVAGHVVIVSGTGTVSFLRAGDEFEVAGTVDLEEPVRATPAVVTDQLFLRTSRHLLAVGPRRR